MYFLLLFALETLHRVHEKTAATGAVDLKTEPVEPGCCTLSYQV